MLKKETFHQLSALVFTAAGTLHLVRAINQWDLIVNDVMIPVWASWATVGLTWCLAWYAYKHLKK